jgi:hypothetical protein
MEELMLEDFYKVAPSIMFSESNDCQLSYRIVHQRHVERSSFQGSPIARSAITVRDRKDLANVQIRKKLQQLGKSFIIRTFS